MKERGIEKKSGFALNTERMNPDNFDEIFYPGDSIEVAIEEFFRRVERYWIDSIGEGQVFEDIMEAVEYAEENSDVSFEQYKAAHSKTNQSGDEN